MTSDDLRKALTAVYDDHGELTPELVVEEAAAPDSPLHDYFEWDDRIAGAAYRFVQASQLIRRVTVTVTTGDELREIRAFVHVPTPDRARGSYLPEPDARRDPVARAVVLASMRREWLALRRRYQHLNEFWTLVVEQPGDDNAQQVG